MANKKQEKIDENQKLFIEIDKDSFITAPAGSGKTYSLIEKIKYIIENKKLIYPKRILVLTLSNVAKHTVEQRLPDIDCVDVLNFSNFASRILKIHSQKYLGFQYNYSYKNLKFNLKSYTDIQKQKSLKKEIKSINQTFPLIDFDKNRITKYFTETNYNKKEIYYDVIVYFAIVLLNYFNVNKIYHNLYSYIFIDECQDMNLSHFLLVRSIKCDNNNIFFLGDMFQSIMKFADALCEDLKTEIDKLYPDIEKIEFHQNYRVESKEIEIFQKSIRDRKKDIASKKSNIELEETINYQYQSTLLCEDVQLENSNLIIKSFQTREKEIYFIIDKLKELKDRNSSIAIICPSYTSFYNYKNKDLYEYGVDVLYQYLKNIKYLDTLKIDNVEQENIYNCLCQLKDTTYKNVVNEIKDVYPDTIELIKGYNNYCKQFNISFKDTIANILGEKDLCKFATFNKDIKLHILNIHQAKGAEWDYVFIPLMNKNLFPSYYGCSQCSKDCADKDFDTKEIINEDFYNLLYVAITRAKKGLFITATKGEESCLFKHIVN